MSDFLFFSSFRRALNNVWERIHLSLNHCSVSNAHCQLLHQEVQHHCTSSQMKKGWWRKLVKFKNLHLPFIVQLEIQIHICTHLFMYTPIFLWIQPGNHLVCSTIEATFFTPIIIELVFLIWCLICSLVMLLKVIYQIKNDEPLFPYHVMSHILVEKAEDHSLICYLVRSVALLSSCNRSMVKNDRMVIGGR